MTEHQNPALQLESAPTPKSAKGNEHTVQSLQMTLWTPGTSLETLYHPPQPQEDQIKIHSTSYPFISPARHAGKLDGKTVLVTGAGRGIGRATALAFARAGARVACIARTRTDLDRLVEEIESLGRDDTTKSSDRQSLAIDGDVCSIDFATKAVNQVKDYFHAPIDILINNAGKSRISPVAGESDIDAAWTVMETNIRGSMNFVHAFLEQSPNGAPSTIPSSSLSPRKKTIINVVSIIGTKCTLPYFSAYSASKAAMTAYTRSMHLELFARGIRTFALHPCMSKETSIGIGAFDHAAASRHEGKGMNAFLNDFLASEHDSVYLPADTMVALCVEDNGAEVLCGEFVDGTYDLEETIARARMVSTEDKGI